MSFHNYINKHKQKKPKRVIPLKRKTNSAAKYSQIKQRCHKDKRHLCHVTNIREWISFYTWSGLFFFNFNEFFSYILYTILEKEPKKTFEWTFRVLFKKQFTPCLIQNSLFFLERPSWEQKDENFNSFSLSHPEYIHLLWRGGYLKEWENSIYMIEGGRMFCVNLNMEM